VIDKLKHDESVFRQWGAVRSWSDYQGENVVFELLLVYYQELITKLE